jgi:hypothetical protein
MQHRFSIILKEIILICGIIVCESILFELRKEVEIIKVVGELTEFLTERQVVEST